MIMSKDDTTYNGWKNYETWNVALWINNDEGLYHWAKDYRRYKDFITALRELGANGNKAPSITYETPDGVAWLDSGLDYDRLDSMLAELRDEDEDPTPAHGGTGGAPESDHLEPQHFKEGG